MMSHEKWLRGRGDLDATSIVLDLQKFHPAVFDCNAYRGGTRIQAVLYELLQGRRGPVNDLRWKLSSVLRWYLWAARYLPRCNFVNHGLLKPYYWLWLCSIIRRGVSIIRHYEPRRGESHGSGGRCERWRDRERFTLGGELKLLKVIYIK